MKKIKLLVVDDHPIVREGLKLIFETEEEIEIADEANNGIYQVKPMQLSYAALLVKPQQ